MFLCPACHVDLKRAQAKVGVFWICPSCGGRSATVALLRQHVQRETVNALWQNALSPHWPKKRACPACLAPMTEVALQTGPSDVAIDVCTRCQFVWFDAAEYLTLPQLPVQKSFMESLPPEARERYALIKIQEIREQAEQADEAVALPTNWQAIPLLLGLPVECEPDDTDKRPWVTWWLSLVVAAVSLSAFGDLSGVIARFGLIPNEALRDGGLTFATSFFLHGGLFHLVSNVYFLMVFGDNVEQALGRWRYAALIALAALVGDAGHIMTDPASTVPCVGASGGISGVIAFYALAFPHARLSILLRWGAFFKRITCSAFVFFLVWLLLQAVGLEMQQAGQSQVSAAAHLGGVAVGFFFWALGNRNGEVVLFRGRKKNK